MAGLALVAMSSVLALPAGAEAPEAPTPAPAESQTVETPPEAEVPPPTESSSGASDFKVEWVSLRVGGGLYGGGGELGLFTLCSKHLFYEIVRFAFYGGAPTQIGSGASLVSSIGGAFGGRWTLDAKEMHELRFGPGAHFLSINGGEKDRQTGNCFFVCTIDESAQAIGLGVSLDIYYLYYPRKQAPDPTQKIAFQAGLAAYALAYGAYGGMFDKVNETRYPWPSVVAFIGFRI